MHRAVLTLGGTVAGIAALLAVKFQPASSTLAGAGTLSVGTQSAPATSAAPSGGAGVSGTGSKAPAGGAQSPATARPSATASPKPKGGTGQSTATRVITGAVANTNYGPMQVRITVAGGKITKVNVVQQTDVGSYSSQVDSMAIPQLTSETLSAQSAKIDAVSGASYTSAGYIQSLQSALDQAGL